MFFVTQLMIELTVLQDRNNGYVSKLLIRHMRKHSNSPPFSSDLCNFGFLEHYDI